MEIEDINLRTAIARQHATGWHYFLLGQTARQFEQLQQDYISATQQWNSASFWAKNLALALSEFGWTIWKHQSEILHDNTGVHRISKREINDNVTQYGRMVTPTSLPKIRHSSKAPHFLGCY
jgi:hypothetical protein